MYLLWVDAISCANSVEIGLQRSDLQIDPRPVGDDEWMKFEITTIAVANNGTTTTMATITRTDDNKFYIPGTLKFRVYDPAKESVPKFDTHIYSYQGVTGEKAPNDTLVGIVDPSVKIIQGGAFGRCTKMKVCIMQDDVEVIEDCAFTGCSAMKVIRLSRALKRIGKWAFHDCESLDAIFLPPTLEEIGYDAFMFCKNIRIVSLPLNLNIAQMGEGMVRHCNSLFRTTSVQPYQGREIYQYVNATAIRYKTTEFNYEQVHQAMLDFYSNLPPLHKACLDTQVTPQKIHEYICTHGTSTAHTIDYGGMTPLHILAMNPHATAGSILACFHWNKHAAIVQDHSGRTPLDYACDLRQYYEDNLESLFCLIQALCLHWDATNSLEEREGVKPDRAGCDTKRQRIN